MPFTSLTPVLRTADMERSVRFYVDLLGFTCRFQTPDYSNLTRDEVRIILGTPNAHEPWHGSAFTGQLYIELAAPDEIDALWERVKERVEFIYAPDDFDYGMREFGIRDDSGAPKASG